MKTKKKLSPIERFIALSDAEKDADVAEFENRTDPKAGIDSSRHSGSNGHG